MTSISSSLCEAQGQSEGPGVGGALRTPGAGHIRGALEQGGVAKTFLCTSGQAHA